MNTQRQNQETAPMTMCRTGVRRPNWICGNVKQNVVLVRDASASMYGQKAKDASAASLDLGGGSSTALQQGWILHGHDRLRDPIEGRSPPGESNDLERPRHPLEDRLVHLFDEHYRRPPEGPVRFSKGTVVSPVSLTCGPVTILFTDGCHNSGPEPHEVADRLKLIADLVTVAFGSDADETLLRALASTPQHFYRCSSGKELRKLLAKVGATMTATMAAGANATRALTTLHP